MSNLLQMKRKSMGFTQAELAKLAGITERRVRCYEASGTANLPDVLTAIRIADALGVSDLREIWDGYPRITC